MEKLNRNEKSTEGNWPTEARRLKEWTAFTYAALCWDVFVTLSPAIFIGKFVLSPTCCCFPLENGKTAKIPNMLCSAHDPG